MNIKDLIFPVSFAFVTMFALNYFFPGSSGKEEIETSFVAPKERKEYRPLNLEVDFYERRHAAQPVVTDLTTAWGQVSFSTEGASLETIDFTRDSNGQTKIIRTVFPLDETERENRCFLVALQEKTPFDYSLISMQESDNVHELIYLGNNDVCIIQKVFIIDKKFPKIDLFVEIAPKYDQHIAVEPRIFFPAPVMPDIKDSDVVSSIVIDQSYVFAKKQAEKLDLLRGWFKPALFGTDSRYFIHSLIKDSNSFAQRAYYKLNETTPVVPTLEGAVVGESVVNTQASLNEKTRLISILEGPVVNGTTSWHLSFYFGPKELDVLAAVDARLEKTLDYSGLLSSISKIMLYILKWLYNYVHNYGLAIILLTLLIQLLLLPLSLGNDEEKFKKKQLEYQRELSYIEQRFKDRPEQLTTERAELIRRKGLPLPGFGCMLPLLLQIPLFIALRNVLTSSFELYHAPMLWISDLSLRDPYYILPVLFALTMLSSLDSNKGDSQQRTMKIFMAIVIGVAMSSFSAGLVLYIVAGQIFGMMKTKAVKYYAAR